MIPRGVLPVLVGLDLIFLASSTAPEISSYARVSTTGYRGGTNVTGNQPVSQGRAFQDVTISRSPIYVPSKVAKLRNGEAVDHPSRYSTLDREAVARLDSTGPKQAQDRFHPPASFEHSLAHANAVRQSSASSASSMSTSGSADSATLTSDSFPVPGYATLPRDAYSPTYGFQADSKPPNDPPTSGSGDDYAADSGDSFSKIPDSYQKPDIFPGDPGEDTPKFSGFSSYGDDKYGPKPVEFPDHYDRPTFDHHEYPHDLIYDHPPDDHFHHHTTTTEEPEMNDQRLSKRPYSYYYIGKKLWYLPLYFSIYFIFYIAALVLKSITRHKINFPASLAAVAADAGRSDSQAPSWFGLTKKVLDGIDAYNGIGKSTNS